VQGPRRIAFINEKGGSAKTTLVSMIAAYLALHRGRRVLAIDMDPQGQLGKVFGLEVRKPVGSSIELLVDSLLGDPSSDALDTGAIRRRLPISHTRIAGLDVIATVCEDEGLTLVLTELQAHARALPVRFRAARITLSADTALDAVGIAQISGDALAVFLGLVTFICFLSDLSRQVRRCGS